MTVLIIDTDNRTARQSKNLRGILEHTRVHGKPDVTVTQIKDGAAVYCRWPTTGDTCHVDFASFEVACEWFKQRSRNLELHPEGYPCL